MPNAAARLQPLLESLIGGPLPVGLRCWDGSVSGPANASATVVFAHRRALRRLVWSPDELGFARAFVAGDLDIEGDIDSVLDMEDVIAKVATNEGLTLSTAEKLKALRTAVVLGAVGRQPALPPEEIRSRRGLRHSLARDTAVVSHHYDVGNDFYRLVLGESMVYSCAYWREAPSATYSLQDAQRDKLELVATKLGLAPGMRVLDVGCGWGSFLLHAARDHGVHGVGVTLSAEQATLARERVAEAGLSDRIEIRQQDYRETSDGPYDAIASIGMSEHVGRSELAGYVQHLAGLLRPGGRLLNHAISSIEPDEPDVEQRSSFIDRYVFPDGEVLPMSHTIDAMERAALEVRDVQALREHYGDTLRGWVENLSADKPAAVALVGEGRYRVWELYMAASALAFELGQLGVNQVLAVKPGARSASGMSRVRDF